MSGVGDRNRGRVAVVLLLAITLALVAATLVLAPATRYFTDADDVLWVLGAAVFSAAGTVIVRAHPRHRIGWAFVGIGVLNAVTYAATSYALLGIERDVPFAAVAAWISTWTWAPALGLVVVVIGVFPTGRAVNRWFGSLTAAGLLAALVITFVNAVALWSVRAPELASADSEMEVDNIAMAVLTALFPVVLLGAIAGLASLLVRFRRADGAERAQLKWLAVAALFMAPAILAGEVLGLDGVALEVSEVFAAPVWLAVAASVAVLRFRLYDVDRIISRTLSYAVLTAVLLGLYAVSVVGLGTAARAIVGESSDLVVAASTLVVAAAFQPARRRVQAAVDRRFNRARIDGLRAVDDFGRRLRDEVDLHAVVTDLRRTAVRVVEPTMASVVPVAPTPGGRP